MRKLKFRAWGKTGQDCWEPKDIMVYFDLLHIPEFVLYSFCSKDSDQFAPRFEIMQFTGLYDKNGREIYEGDILGGVYEGCYIGWCDECKQIQLIIPVYGCMACLGDVHWYELVEQDGKLEVIGNIWENPELLPQ